MLGPAGRFSCARHPADKLLLISAGSGVTPVMSMLRFLADVAAPVQVCFVNNVRTPGDIIFERELMHLAAQLGSALSLWIVPARLEPSRSWNGATGQISAALLQFLVPDLAERETFLCGPAGYMTAVREILRTLDYPMERLHEESFGGGGPSPPGTASVAPPTLPAAAPAQPRVRRLPEEQALPRRNTPDDAAPEVVFGRSGKVAAGVPGETVLELASRVGVALESSCRSGACGTCRIAKLEGRVEMAGQCALSVDEIEAGEILACVAVAHGRVVLDA